jgi:hypothetical protein
MAPKLVRLSPIVCYSNNISSAKKSVNCGSDLNRECCIGRLLTIREVVRASSVFCVLLRGGGVVIKTHSPSRKMGLVRR